MTAREILDDYMATLQREHPRLTDGHGETIKRLRRDAFMEHARAMIVPDSLKKWAQVMRSMHGDVVRVWGVSYSSYLVALMVIRYGEAIEHWPLEFTEFDERRAIEWQTSTGKPVAGVSYAEAQKETGPNPDDLLTPAGKLIVMFAAVLMAGILWATDSGLFSYTFPIILFGTAMTDYLENKVIDHIFRTTSFTKPTVLAVALFTAAPGETGGGTEVSGGSYARVSNNPLNANWVGTHGTTTGDSSGTGGVTSNAGILTFPTPSASWGTVTHQALFDATTSGNMLIYSALTVSKTVNNGDPAPTFAANALTVTAA